MEAVRAARRLVMVQSQDPTATDPKAWQFQPVFCLMHRSLAPSLADFLNAGGHKVTHWATAQTGFVACPIATLGKVPHPFANANTFEKIAREWHQNRLSAWRDRKSVV